VETDAATRRRGHDEAGRQGSTEPGSLEQDRGRAEPQGVHLDDLGLYIRHRLIVRIGADEQVVLWRVTFQGCQVLTNPPR
jgi:hypothetical protein